MFKSKNKRRRFIYNSVALLITIMLALTGLGVYFAINKKEPTPPPAKVDPLDWAIDDWDGESVNADSWINGDKFANRGNKSYTIDSAESFAYFIDIVNNEDIAKEYNFFKGYTVYLNTSIDLAGNSIDPIGIKIVLNNTICSTFQGTFDGSYYTIYNAKINGNGLFSYTENATIRNIGLYNPTINSTSNYTGGIVGEAINTNIENVYVSAGSITGTGIVAGLVGKYTSSNGNHSINNSFADTIITAEETAGLVGYIETNSLALNLVEINNSYYTIVDNAFFGDNNYIEANNVFMASNKSQFVDWDYASEYTLDNTWCDYTFVEGSEKLDFDYPILTRFNKAFITGSCYENTVKNLSNGEVINVETIADAFATAGSDDELEVNIIVEKVYIKDTAVIDGNAKVTLNTAVDTTIVRADSSISNMIIGAENSTLVLGQENATDTTAKLIFDGQKEYFKAHNLTTGAAVYVQGYDFEIYSNVIIKDNINNKEGYGGGLFVNELNSGNQDDATVAIMGGATITNCEAKYDGGGACIVWNADNTNIKLNITNCKSNTNGGGLAIIEDIDENLQTVNAMVKKYGGRYQSYKPMSRWSKTGATSTTVTGTYSGNSTTSYGGGVYFETTYGGATLTLEGDLDDSTLESLYKTKIYSNSAANGGGVAARDNDTTNDGAVVVMLYDVLLGTHSPTNTDTRYGNTATNNGGGVFCRGSINVTGGYCKFNHASGKGGGLYRENSGTNHGFLGIYSCGTGSGYVQEIDSSGLYPPAVITRNTSATEGNNTYGFGSATYYTTTNSSQLVYYYDNLPTASITGYKFTGCWATSSSSTTTSHVNTVNKSSSGTFYAIYCKEFNIYNHYYYENSIANYTSVLFSCQSASNNSSYTYTFNANIQKLPVGYEFAGYTTTNTCIEYTNEATTYNETDGSSCICYDTPTADSIWGNGNSTAPTFISIDVSKFTTSEATLNVYAVYKKQFTFYYSEDSAFGTKVITLYYGYNVNATIYSNSIHYGSETKAYTYESTKLGYSFYGYSNTSELVGQYTGDIYENNGIEPVVIVSNTSTVNQSTSTGNYYAVFKRTWNWYYSNNGSNTITSGYYKYDTIANAEYYQSNILNMTNYTFVGWSTANDTNLEYSADVPLTEKSGSFYAVWHNTSGTRLISETLTHNFYSVNDLVYDTATSIKTIPYVNVEKYFNYDLTESRTLTTGGVEGTPTYSTLTYSNIPNHSAFDFSGWSRGVSTNPLTLGSLIDTPTENTNYYAVWTKTWKFYDNYDSVITYEENYEYNSSELQYYIKANPTLVNYTFVGYSYDNDNEVEITAGDSETTINTTASITSFYAVWLIGNGSHVIDETLIHTFYLTNDSDKIEVNTIKTYEYINDDVYWNYSLSNSRQENNNFLGNTSYSPLAFRTATKDGYEFLGWATSENVTTATWMANDRTPTDSETWYAVWVELVSITINITGNTNNSTYGIVVNNITHTTSFILRADIRQSDVVTIGGTDNNQLLIVYVNGKVQVPATYGSINDLAVSSTWFTGEDCIVDFVFKSAYKQNIILDGTSSISGVTIETATGYAQEEYMSSDGYIVRDTKIKLTVNESTLVGNSNKAFLGFSYTIGNDTFATLNEGDSRFIKSDEGYIYTTIANVTNITIYVKNIITSINVNADALLSEITIQNEDGFVMSVSADMTSIFEGSWTITSGNIADGIALFSTGMNSNGKVTQSVIDGKYIFTFTLI